MLGLPARTGLVAIALVVLAGGCGSGDDVRVVSGVSIGVAADGSATSLDEDGGSDGEGYTVGYGIEWIGTDGSTRDAGQPECLPPMSAGAEVRLHVIRYEGRDRVLLVECLTLPTELFTGGWTGPSPFDTYCDARARTAAEPRVAPGAVDACRRPSPRGSRDEPRSNGRTGS